MSAQTLYLLKYNNYYDRTVKKESDLSSYLLFDSDYIHIENYNFNENDGINSTISGIPFALDQNKNYALVCDSDGTVLSRWFIMEAVRIREGQFQLSLQRDVLSDFLSNIIEAPAFIEKATLSNDDPFIYNKEDVTVNQIKNNELLIRDSSRVPWLVAYITRKTSVTEKFTESTDNRSGTTTTVDVSRFYGTDPIRVNIPSRTYVSNDYTTNTMPMSPAFSSSNPDAVRYSSYLNDFVFSHGDVSYVLKSTKSIGYGRIVTVFYVVNINETEIHISYYEPFNSSYKRMEITEIPFFLGDSEFIRYVSNNLPGHPQIVYTTNGNRLIGASDRLAPGLTEPTHSGKINKDLVSGEFYNINTVNVTSYNESVLGDVGSYPCGVVSGQYASTFYNDYFSTIFEEAEITSVGSISEIRVIPGKVTSSWFDANVTSTIGYNMFYHINSTESQVLYIDTNTISSSLNHTRCSDACYDIVYIPYFDGTINIVDSSTSQSVDVKMTKELGLTIMQRIKTCCGDNCVDIQIVPYCPDRPIHKFEVFGSGSDAYLKVFVDSINDLAPMYKESDVSDFPHYVDEFTGGITNATCSAFWSSSCSNSFSTDIFYNEFGNSEQSYGKVSTVIKGSDSKKVASQCNFARIVSPNYNGQFEFVPAKIGSVSTIDIDYMYMPYSPYIHVSPKFGGLYGRHDFNGKNDATGLVCNGSFSIPQYDDKWADYQIQNKNYQDIFDREIKNMEVGNTLKNVNNAVNIFAGTAGGAIGGAVAGKSPASIATGAITGAIKGITSFATGIVGQQEALDYKKDLYAMQMGNIAALPYSLSNVGVFNNNNKIFPFVELYSCTETEKIAFENKIKYNGMTVGRISTISAFLDVIPDYTYVDIGEYNYIKAKIIRYDGISDDNHLMQFLANELDKGAFFRREY